MAQDNVRNARTLKLLAAASLLGAAMAMTPAYAADAPAGASTTGQSMKMTPADQAKWDKKAKAKTAWHKSKAKWGAPDKKPAQ